MDLKKITIAGFILTCLAQLFIPANMILDREDVLKTGTEYKFRTAPIDPNDPFRGKYIVLSFQENTFPVNDQYDWTMNDPVFVEFTTDANGFAKIKNVAKTPPKTSDYLHSTIAYIDQSNDQYQLVINYPFDRFYMEESKALPAEEAYREAALDSTQVAYALVHLKNGTAVLKDVMIDGKSIKDLVE